MSKSWSEEIDNIIRSFNSNLITGSEFNECIIDLCKLDGSPYKAVQFIVYNSMVDYVELKYGNELAEPVGSISNKNPLNGNWVYTVKTWLKPENIKADDKIEELFLSFWKSDYRSEKSHIIGIQVPEATRICQRYLGLPTCKKFTVFAFGDLDNFNQVNDFISHNEGDRVIAEFGALLLDCIDKKGIVVHVSGDEFIIIIRCNLIEDALVSLYLTSKKIRMHDFNLKSSRTDKDKRTGEAININQEIKVDVSFGITFFANKDEVPSWEQLYKKADDTMSKKTKEAKRSTARISDFRVTDYEINNHNFDYKAAFLIAKANIDSRAPFANVWLNVLSMLLSLKDELNIEQEFNNFKDWVQYDVADETFFNSNDICVLLPKFSPLEILAAISHGLVRSEKYKKLKWGNKENKILIIDEDDNVIWSYDSNYKLPALQFIGSDESDNIRNLIPQNNWAKRAMLIQVGHNISKIPSNLFIETIIVDDRPTNGGALPDFWERVLAQLIFTININKNITHIAIFGEGKNAGKIIKLLSEINNWDKQWLSDKTKSQTNQIGEVIKRLESGNIIIENDNIELLNKLFIVYESEVGYHAVPDYEKKYNTTRFLKRNAILEKEIKLQSHDGIRIGTICEAYPMILDIMRSMLGNKEMLFLYDQAGQEYLELTDFKVHLTNAESDLVPYFFAKGDDQESLNKYYNEAFGEKGLFFSKLQSDESNQYKHVINHIVDTISDVGKKFSTRRAILVISHNTSENTALSPLGLISIRMMPTYEAKTVRINFSYTWRTVEAVIGFPYSIYGSVNFSKKIIQDITNEVKEKNPSLVVKMGSLSYIAHSLHMFTDTFTQEIVRGIINDAST